MNGERLEIVVDGVKVAEVVCEWGQVGPGEAEAVWSRWTIARARRGLQIGCSCRSSVAHPAQWPVAVGEPVEQMEVACA